MASNRRDFLKTLSLATGSVVLMPVVSACGGAQTPAGAVEPDPAEPPRARPEGWEPISYNRDRGNAGFIPDTYRADINGPDGEHKHLGKHLPYVPDLSGLTIPTGFLAVMWGDPAKGHAKHPNAVPNDANHHEGHWYNWIRVRKATTAEAQELESMYLSWPGTDETSGSYAVFGGGDITADDGKNTIYLAALPPDVKAGDLVRIWAHCLTHGEYVDYLTVA
jgi:hypothetical protein